MSTQTPETTTDVIPGQEKEPTIEQLVAQDEKPEDEKKEPESETEEDKPEETPEKETDKERKRRNQDRAWQRLVLERAEYKAKAELLESQLRQNVEPADEFQRPTRDQFENGEDYVEALVSYNERLAQEIPERIAQSQQQPGRTEEDLVQRKADREFIKSHDDFEEAIAEVDNQDYALHGVAIDAVRDSPINAELRYYLATHQDEFEDIVDTSKSRPVRAAQMIGLIERELMAKSKKPAKTTNAPDPRKPVGSRGSAERDPEKMSMQEFAKWDAARLASKNKR